MAAISPRAIIIGTVQILDGFRVILFTSEFNINTRLILLTDLVRFLIKLCLVIVFSNKYRQVTINAFKYKVNFESYTAFFYLFNEIFCRQVYRPYKGLTLYIDAGANIGMTILWYHLFNPKVRILAFEPEPTCYQLLLKNIKENKITGCIVRKVALSNHTGKSNYYLLDDPVQILDSGLLLNQNLPHTVSTVDTVLLSSFIKEPVSLLKVDIEGSEYAVLNDLIDSDKLKYIQQSVIETHYFNAKEGAIFNNLVNKLKKYGVIKLFTTSNRSSVIEFKASSVRG